MQAWLASIYRTGIRTLQGPGDHQGSDQLGDFTTTRRVLWLSAMAIVLGMISAFLALALLRLIGLFTNLFFFQRLDTSLISPANHMLGLWALFVPVVGALSIGCMARYGSERIRGHGIPEAIEAILINGSRVESRVAFLKPLSAAISIGSGGVVIGIGGLIVPEALRVGYETIEALVQGEIPGRVSIGILLVKWIIWSVSLGSGTSVDRTLFLSRFHLTFPFALWHVRHDSCKSLK